MNKPLTVVIPNYNGAHLLRKNLPSVIEAGKFYGDQFFIVVVDDGSVDNSVEVLRQEFPSVHLVIHEENKGFAEAVHSGVKAATSELLFLLNSDVEVEKNIFPVLVGYFDDPTTFSVNPLIYDEESNVKRHSWNLRQFQNGRLKLLSWNLSEALRRKAGGEKLPTAYAHGGSFLVRKSMFMELGGFHPIYKPFYSEDYDLGLRAWRRGWASYFEPNVSIVHARMGSIRTNVKFKYIKTIRRRNRYFLEWTHLSPKQLWLSAIPLSILQLIGEFLLIDIVNLKGFYLALGKIPEVIQARNALKAREKLSIEDVLKIIN